MGADCRRGGTNTGARHSCLHCPWRRNPVMPRESTVFVVDNDAGILKSMRWLIESAGLRVKTFDSGATFLECYDPDDAGCLIVDMRMPRMNGLEVQRHLAEVGAKLPIIVMTAHADVP